MNPCSNCGGEMFIVLHNFLRDESEYVCKRCGAKMTVHERID